MKNELLDLIIVTSAKTMFNFPMMMIHVRFRRKWKVHSLLNLIFLVFAAGSIDRCVKQCFNNSIVETIDWRLISVKYKLSIRTSSKEPTRSILAPSRRDRHASNRINAAIKKMFCNRGNCRFILLPREQLHLEFRIYLSITLAAFSAPRCKYEITASTLSVITTRRVRIISQILIRGYRLLNPVNLSFITSMSFANRSA